MSMKRDTRPRIDRIRAALEKLGPSTVIAIANETGIAEQDVGLIIRDSRKKNWPGTRIRKADKIRIAGKSRSWLYELSDEPDAVVAPARTQPSRVKRIKYPGLTREEILDKKHAAALLAQIRPFRDPLLFLTAGRAA